MHLFEALALVLAFEGRAAVLGEVYPGAAWQRLRTGLEHKKTVAGRRKRRALLAEFCVELPDTLQTHDQLDACLSALLAAAADGRVPGLLTEEVGEPLTVDDEGCRREGVIVVPVALADTPSRAVAAEPLAETPTSRMPRQSSRRVLSWIDGQIDWPLSGAAPEARAQELFRCLTDRYLNDAVASVCSYAEAIDLIFQVEFSQARVPELIRLAREVGGATLANLGSVRLDTFIVAKKSGMPGGGHWRTVDYTEDDWLAVFHRPCS